MSDPVDHGRASPTSWPTPRSTRRRRPMEGPTRRELLAALTNEEESVSA